MNTLILFQISTLSEITVFIEARVGILLAWLQFSRHLEQNKNKFTPKISFLLHFLFSLTSGLSEDNILMRAFSIVFFKLEWFLLKYLRLAYCSAYVDVEVSDSVSWNLEWRSEYIFFFYTSLRWLGFRGNDGGMPGDWKLSLSLVCKVYTVHHFNLSFHIKSNVSTLINIFIKVFWLGILFKQMILNVLKLLVISIIALKWLKQRRGRLSTTLDIGRSTSGELKRGFAGYTVCGFF